MEVYYPSENTTKRAMKPLKFDYSKKRRQNPPVTSLNKSKPKSMLDLKEVEFSFLDNQNVCCGLCGEIIPYDELLKEHLPKSHAEYWTPVHAVWLEV